ncbi:Hypothetical protein NTJ_07789 [Nesidiocoris tenuis]|uniref:Uncharacterized protein n=1 Tax=Nesidiocoris tenuis TaxID=355587 RepID=A0ABN7AVM8_9HEMI|nr:Hypothetical protein NTJ_07789 [Nesidiocoris tenuis]
MQGELGRLRERARRQIFLIEWTQPPRAFSIQDDVSLPSEPFPKAQKLRSINLETRSQPPSFQKSLSGDEPHRKRTLGRTMSRQKTTMR